MQCEEKHDQVMEYGLSPVQIWKIEGKRRK